jgi:hypothetical protein
LPKEVEQELDSRRVVQVREREEVVEGVEEVKVLAEEVEKGESEGKEERLESELVAEAEAEEEDSKLRKIDTGSDRSSPYRRLDFLCPLVVQSILDPLLSMEPIDRSTTIQGIRILDLLEDDSHRRSIVLVLVVERLNSF